MAIDRGPWNALVDDDGSNLVGSIWNKAAIKTVLLDPTDAAIAAAAPTAWTTVPFSAANFPVQAGITAAQVNVNQYSVSNKTLVWMIQMSGAPGSAAATINCVIPAGFTIGACFSPLAHAYDGAFTSGYADRGTATVLTLKKSSGTNWVGPIYIYFTAIIQLV